MKTKCFPNVVLLMTACIGGCSSADVSQVAQLPAQETVAVLKSANAFSGSITSPIGTTSEEATDTVLDAIDSFRNPFAPPKQPLLPPVIEEPVSEPQVSLPAEPTPEIRQPGTPPKIRLLGFLTVGEPKVLVSYQDKPQTLAIGDTLEGLTVTDIESQELTMLFEDRELKYSLSNQALREKSTTPAAERDARTLSTTAPTRPTGNASSSTFAGSTVDKPTRGSSIPGFAPYAGRPPAFRPPTSPAVGVTSAPTSANPPADLPGLTSQTGSGETLGVDGIPNIPGFDVEANGQVRTHSLPSLPGGLP